MTDTTDRHDSEADGDTADDNTDVILNESVVGHTISEIVETDRPDEDGLFVSRGRTQSLRTHRGAMLIPSGDNEGNLAGAWEVTPINSGVDYTTEESPPDIQTIVGGLIVDTVFGEDSGRGEWDTAVLRVLVAGEDAVGGLGREDIERYHDDDRTLRSGVQAYTLAATPPVGGRDRPNSHIVVRKPVPASKRPDDPESVPKPEDVILGGPDDPEERADLTHRAMLAHNEHLFYSLFR